MTKKVNKTEIPRHKEDKMENRMYDEIDFEPNNADNPDTKYGKNSPNK